MLLLVTMAGRVGSCDRCDAHPLSCYTAVMLLPPDASPKAWMWCRVTAGWADCQFLSGRRFARAGVWVRLWVYCWSSSAYQLCSCKARTGVACFWCCFGGGLLRARGVNFVLPKLDDLVTVKERRATPQDAHEVFSATLLEMCVQCKSNDAMVMCEDRRCR